MAITSSSLGKETISESLKGLKAMRGWLEHGKSGLITRGSKDKAG